MGLGREEKIVSEEYCVMRGVETHGEGFERLNIETSILFPRVITGQLLMFEANMTNTFASGSW